MAAARRASPHHLPSRVARTAAEPRRARGRLAADDAAHGGAGPAGGAGRRSRAGTSSRRRRGDSRRRRASPSGVDEGNFDGRTFYTSRRRTVDWTSSRARWTSSAPRRTQLIGGAVRRSTRRPPFACGGQGVPGGARRGAGRVAAGRVGPGLTPDAAVKGDTSRLRRLAAQKQGQQPGGLRRGAARYT